MEAHNPIIYISAGEPSGDRHGSLLVRAIRERLPGAAFFGLCGPAMQAEGVRLLAGVDRLAIMGFTEVLIHLPFLWFLKRRIRREMLALRPDLAVFIDYPGYNLNIARLAKSLGIPVLYYISPQIWAWKEHRKHKVAARADALAVILPFEKACYEGTGLDVRFVGHPSIEEARPSMGREEFFRANGLDPAKPLLALFPGSRKMEIRHILPVFLATVAELGRRLDGMQAAISMVAPGDPPWLSRLAALHPRIAVVREDRYNLAAHADAVLTKSGTSTIEAAILGVPMVVVYRGPHISYRIARWFHRLPHISLVNIVAGEEVVPEFVQYEARPAAIASALEPLLDRGSAVRGRMVEKLGKVRSMLGDGSASSAVADMAAELIARKVREA